MTIEDLDRWRENYPTMTDADHLAFADRSEAEHPNQQHYHAGAVLGWLKDKPGNILEIGGWKGELAAKVLPQVTNERWTNFEISQRAIDAGLHCDRYFPVRPQRFRWWQSEIRDEPLVIASHVLEHIAYDDVVDLVFSLKNATHWFVECPLDRGPTDWNGYYGAHILNVGWDGLEDVFNGAGFDVCNAGKWIRTFSR